MKNALIIICSIILFCAASAKTYAGFRIKKAATNFETAATVTNPPTDSPALSKKEQRRETVKALKTVRAAKIGQDDHPRKRSSDSGWLGIVALVCGILSLGMLYPAFAAIFGTIGLGLGLLMLLAPASPAIIFGATGMGRGHGHRGLAIAGFIMGLVAIAFILLVLPAFLV